MSSDTGSFRRTFPRATFVRRRRVPLDAVVPDTAVLAPAAGDPLPAPAGTTPPGASTVHADVRQVALRTTAPAPSLPTVMPDEEPLTRPSGTRRVTTLPVRPAPEPAPKPKRPIPARPQPIAAINLGSGDPLLLLHGFLLSPHCWEQVAARMAARCEVFAPALPGHWGGPPVDGPLDVGKLADEIERMLDEKGWRTCHIAGNSLGGWIGAELARRGRARTLTLIAPAGGWGSPSLTQFRVGLKFLALVPLAEAGKRIGVRPMDNPVVRRLAGYALAKHPGRIASRDSSAAVQAVLQCAAMVPLLLGGVRHPALPDLATLGTPVRLLLAEYDRVIPNRVYARRYLAELPDSADLILVNGVGHVPMLEAPDRIATLIAEHVYASRSRLKAL
ncbi:alpha/beta fold hydrolase [Nocardia sp. NPDC057227]|uniref:alpha/beta fold hydrolase n=1 Tax=Nocardia sp. NPDC057227 TaxID=3346056 RepID=UPI0036443CEE